LLSPQKYFLHKFFCRFPEFQLFVASISFCFVIGEPVIEEVEEEDDILEKQEGDNDINEDDIEAGDFGDSVQITEISEPDTPSS
jgi:hypothetical protein